MVISQANIPFWLHPAGFIECFSKVGASVDKMLSDAGLQNTDDLFSTENFITPEQQNALILSGVKQANIERPGLFVGINMPWCYYGQLAHVIDSGPSLKEVGAAFRRFTPIAQPNQKAFMSRIDFYLEDKDTLVVPIGFPHTARTPEAVRQFDMDYRTAIFLRILDSCGFKGDGYAGLELRMSHEKPFPRYFLENAPLVQVTYGHQQTVVVAEHDFFYKEWRPFRRVAFSTAIESCEAEYRKRGLYDSLEDSVRWMVDMSFTRVITLEKVASKFGISARTLNRKLAATGTSFREIVYQSRMNIVMRQIRYSKMSTESIAELMGFSSKFSLMRAVKNWSGLTVTEITSTDNE